MRIILMALVSIFIFGFLTSLQAQQPMQPIVLQPAQTLAPGKTVADEEEEAQARTTGKVGTTLMQAETEPEEVQTNKVNTLNNKTKVEVKGTNKQALKGATPISIP